MTSTPSLPKIPTNKAIAAKVAKYSNAAFDHERGLHDNGYVGKFCKACNDKKRGI